VRATLKGISFFMYTFCALYGVLNVQLGQSRFGRDCEGRRDRVNERATVKRFRNELKIQRCRCRRKRTQFNSLRRKGLERGRATSDLFLKGDGEGYDVFPLMRTSVRAVGVKRTSSFSSVFPSAPMLLTEYITF